MQIQNFLILVAASAVSAHKNFTRPDPQTHASGFSLDPRAVPTGAPQPSWAHGQNITFNGWHGALKAAADADDAKSAGDYYSSPTTSAGTTASFPTDTSDVSATANELPPAPTVSDDDVENAAATVLGASSVLGSFVAVLAACLL